MATKPRNEKSVAKEDTPTVRIERDGLASEIADAINKEFKQFEMVHFLNGQAEQEVAEWISTGDDVLDLRIANKPHGGIPIGRITEIFGGTSSGKSLLTAHIIAECQRRGGIAVLFDTEHACSEEFMRAIGVDTTNLLYVANECLEEIFAQMEKIIMKVREDNRDRLLLIVVDSVMGATTQIEMEQDYQKEGWATTKAQVMSKAMRKLCGLIARQRIALVLTNQVRDRLGVTFGDKETTSGGHGLSFAASVRLKMTKLGKIKVDKETLGVQTRVTVEKNRVGPPYRHCDINIYFDRGIDRFASWLNILKFAELAEETGGSKPKVTIKGGLEIPKKEWNETLANNQEIRDTLYGIMCDALIMKYRSPAETLDSISISQDPVEE